MDGSKLAGAAGIIVAICAVCGHAPGPANPTQSSSQSSIPAVNYHSADFTDPNTAPDPGAGQAAADMLKVATTPVPGEDELIAAIHAKYGSAERQLGESGASWCKRQRLMSQMAGADISEMDCSVDGTDYPDLKMSPNAAVWR